MKKKEKKLSSKITSLISLKKNLEEKLKVNNFSNLEFREKLLRNLDECRDELKLLKYELNEKSKELLELKKKVKIEVIFLNGNLPYLVC